MASTIERWILFLGFLAVIGVAGPGCDRSCAYSFRCGPMGLDPGGGGAGGAGGGEPDPCPADPADGPVRADCGVWVSSSWGDDSQPGTQTAPVATLARAIELAAEGTHRIYACGETYPEVVRLPAGISLAGGFSCARGIWSYDGPERRALIAPGVPALAALLLTKGEGETTGEGGSVIRDVEVRAADAVDPGASSIAVFSLAGARADLRRCHLIAGNGADGASGEPGNHDGAPAQKGLPGNPGEEACTSNPGLGGVAVELECDDGTATIGGKGGDGGEAAADDGAAGAQPPDPNPQGYGAAGKGESLAQGTACTPGIGGAQGNSGAHGLGAVDHGHLTKDGYVGVAGADGFPGTPGQGGGGGGGSVGDSICGGAPHGGAGGGSGGTGGCGGKPGKGGQAGGASIALAMLTDETTIKESLIVTGAGGKGGNGGALQPGGQGGFPGLGGFGFGGASGVKGGCSGGVGGQGGNGGNGGGGRGGHSIGIVTAGPAGISITKDVTFVYGNPGAGGKGGNPNIRGTDGQMGITAFAFGLLP